MILTVLLSQIAPSLLLTSLLLMFLFLLLSSSSLTLSTLYYVLVVRVVIVVVFDVIVVTAVYRLFWSRLSSISPSFSPIFKSVIVWAHEIKEQEAQNRLFCYIDKSFHQPDDDVDDGGHDRFST